MMCSSLLDNIIMCMKDPVVRHGGSNPGGVLKFGFRRDVPPRNLKVDPYKYQFFKKK